MSICPLQPSENSSVVGMILEVILPASPQFNINISLLRKHCYYTITLLQQSNHLASSPADLVFQAIYPPMSLPACENTSFQMVMKQTWSSFQFCCQLLRTCNYK